MEDNSFSIDAAFADDEDQASALLRRIAQRDRRAMDLFYGLFQESVYRFALSLRSDPAAASDVLNDTMLRLWTQADQFDGESTALCWVLGLAFRTSAESLRGPCWHEADESDFSRPEDEAANLTRALHPCMEDIRRVHDAVASLDGILRGTLHLAFFEDLTHAGIAKVMGCTEGTVETRTVRVRRLLKPLLQAPSNASLSLVEHAEHDCDEYSTLLKLRRALQQPLTPAPGDFGLDRLQQAIDAVEVGERRRHWKSWLKSSLHRWFGSEQTQCEAALH